MTPQGGESARRTGESGIALVISLFIMLAMSVLTASLMILAQSETFGTMNYRMMAQSRYGAESGIHQAVRYILNDYVSVQPGTAGDPLSRYDMTRTPVTYNGQPVVLSATAGIASNYPVAAVVSAFQAAAQGSLQAGRASVQYNASATLISMQPVGAGIAQTWQITADGSMTGSQTAIEEVTATLETPLVPGNGFAAFALSALCGAISLSGGTTTDSYDSSVYSGSGAVTATNGGLLLSGGNVGTNGNLTESGGATVNGVLYTPRTGVGNCSNGGGGVANDALTQSGNATVGAMVQLPQQWVPPPPTIATPSPVPPTSTLGINPATTCGTLGLVSPSTCTKSGSTFTITPNGATISLGSVGLTGGQIMVLNTGTYNFNALSISSGTLTMGGAVQMTIMTNITVSGNSTLSVPNTSGSSLILNVVTSSSTSPVSLSGGAVSNATMDAGRFQLNYAGGNPDPSSNAGPNPSISLSGGTQTAIAINAPYAGLTTSGGTDLYGSFLTKTLSSSGGAHFHYDRHLNGAAYAVAGNPVLTSFSWKRF